METAPSNIKQRLTQLARKVFNNPTLEIDEKLYTATYGMSLEERLKDPRLGEEAVTDYLEFKMAGGYE